jgi:hypothetical protein
VFASWPPSWRSPGSPLSWSHADRAFGTSIDSLLLGFHTGSLRPRPEMRVRLEQAAPLAIARPTDPSGGFSAVARGYLAADADTRPVLHNLLQCQHHGPPRRSGVHQATSSGMTFPAGQSS